MQDHRGKSVGLHSLKANINGVEKSWLEVWKGWFAEFEARGASPNYSDLYSHSQKMLGEVPAPEYADFHKVLGRGKYADHSYKAWKPLQKTDPEAFKAFIHQWAKEQGAEVATFTGKGKRVLMLEVFKKGLFGKLVLVGFAVVVINTGVEAAETHDATKLLDLVPTIGDYRLGAQISEDTGILEGAGNAGEFWGRITTIDPVGVATVLNFELLWKDARTVNRASDYLFGLAREVHKQE